VKALLTLGRMPKGLEVARGLAAAGCEVLVADPHRTHLARHSNAVSGSFRVTAPATSPDSFVKDLLRIVWDQQVDLVVPVSEESVHVARMVDRLPERVRFFGAAFEMARTLHNKYLFNRLAADLGLPVPETALLGGVEATDLAARAPTIVKPVHGSAGIGLHRIEPGCALPTTTARPSLIQERLTGQELSAIAVVYEGHCAGIAVYRGTIMSHSVAIAFERVDSAKPIEAWIRSFAAETNYTGFLSFDFFNATDGSTRAIECNARLTSGIHFLEPEAVGRFLLHPDRTTIIPLKQRRRFQHVFPCLGVTEMSLIKGGFWKNLDALLSSADVTWSRKDPMPLIMMNFCAYPIIRQWMGGKMSLGEAAITDVEWREPEMDRLSKVSNRP
jgi:predicted ATP-grasp superfamily ATP-dependent carboligase